MSFLKNIINGIYQLIKFLPLQDNHSAKFEHWAVLWAPTENLGDDIQTLAAINFLHKKGIYDFEFINREDLCNYNGKPVNLIMNGWFMHDLKNFHLQNIYLHFL